ncbi:MAG: HAD hydrolase family protein [Oscillospiraceae bacterium]|nr:HAD hydrolase family protein [Oscillospiraceae bacterium]
MKLREKLPVPGQRIFRSMVAVWLCFAVYVLRGRHGIPFYSVIAALQCIQPYTKEMHKVGRKRVIGTIVGAVWGLLVLLLELELIGSGVPEEPLHYLLLGLLVGVVIYSTVLLHVKEAAYFSAVVFLTITYNHIGDANPYLFAFNRLFDTVLGVLLAELVNRVHLPRRRNTDVLYVSSVMDTILGSRRQLSAYSKVELNRLLEDGARFTISTTQTQATVRELLQGVELRYPVITMDGAALYDMNSLEYLRSLPMSEAQARQIMDWAHDEKLGFFANSIQENLLVIRYADLVNDGMRQLFQKKRSSPYRNFIHSPVDGYEHIVYLLILDTHERIEAAYAALQAQPWYGVYRVVKDVSEYEGYSFLKIYDANTSREAMLKELEKLMGTRETVRFGSIPGRYDVCIEDADKDRLVKELKRRFEPVDFRCWRTIFRT